MLQYAWMHAALWPRQPINTAMCLTVRCSVPRAMAPCPKDSQGLLEKDLSCNRAYFIVPQWQTLCGQCPEWMPPGVQLGLVHHNESVTCHFPLANLTHKAVTTQLPYVSDIFCSGIGTKNRRKFCRFFWLFSEFSFGNPNDKKREIERLLNEVTLCKNSDPKYSQTSFTVEASTNVLVDRRQIKRFYHVICTI